MLTQKLGEETKAFLALTSLISAREAEFFARGRRVSLFRVTCSGVAGDLLEAPVRPVLSVLFMEGR